jgi:hypothetical protein
MYALRAGEDVSELPQGLSSRSKKEWVEALASFDGDPLTPRQAFKLTMSVAGMEDDGFVGWDDYLAGRVTVDELMFLSELPDWVLFMVNDHWLQRFRQTFLALGKRIDQGEGPYPRCMAEKVALWLMLQAAEDQDDDLERGMLSDDDDLGAALPHHGDAEADWDEVAERLFDEDFDFRFIWLDNFTRLMFGNQDVALEMAIDIDATACHPFRWWERHATTAG